MFVRPKFLCQNMLGIYSINRLLNSMMKISVINNGFHFMLEVLMPNFLNIKTITHFIVSKIVHSYHLKSVFVQIFHLRFKIDQYLYLIYLYFHLYYGKRLTESHLSCHFYCHCIGIGYSRLVQRY